MLLLKLLSCCMSHLFGKVAQLHHLRNENQLQLVADSKPSPLTKKRRGQISTNRRLLAMMSNQNLTMTAALLMAIAWLSITQPVSRPEAPV
jgi:hypothetical protein